MPKVNRWQEWDNSAPTDVDKWLVLYAEDDNTFWATDSGHIMNVVDELIERLSTARADEREKAANDYEHVIGHAGSCYANTGGSCGCGVQAVRHIILTGNDPYSAAALGDGATNG